MIVLGMMVVDLALIMLNKLRGGMKTMILVMVKTKMMMMIMSIYHA